MHPQQKKQRQVDIESDISIFTTPSIMACIFEKLPLISVICMLHVFPCLKKHFNTIRMIHERFLRRYRGLNPIIPQLLHDDTGDFAITGSTILAILTDADWANTINDIDVACIGDAFINRINADRRVARSRYGNHNYPCNSIDKIYYSDDHEFQVMSLQSISTYDTYIQEFDISICSNYFIPGINGKLRIMNISGILKRTCTMAIDQKYIPFINANQAKMDAIWHYATTTIPRRLAKYRQRGYTIGIEYDDVMVQQLGQINYIDEWIRKTRVNL